GRVSPRARHPSGRCHPQGKWVTYRYCSNHVRMFRYGLRPPLPPEASVPLPRPTARRWIPPVVAALTAAMGVAAAQPASGNQPAGADDPSARTSETTAAAGNAAAADAWAQATL